MRLKTLNYTRIWIDVSIIVAGVFIAPHVRAESALAVDGSAQMATVSMYLNQAASEDLSASPQMDVLVDDEVATEQSQEKVALSSQLIKNLDMAGEKVTDVYYLDKKRAGKSIITRAFYKYPNNMPTNASLAVASIYKEEWFGPGDRQISSYYREDARIADAENNILDVKTAEITEAVSEDGKTKIIDQRNLYIKYKITREGLVLISNDFEYISKNCSGGEESITDNYQRTTIYDKDQKPMELTIKDGGQIVLDLVFLESQDAGATQTKGKENVLPLIEFARIANTYDQLIKRENAIRLNKPEAGAFPKLSVTMKQVKHLP